MHYLVYRAPGWWRDLVAVTIFTGIKVYLLLNFGVYDWNTGDSAGYIALAHRFQQWETWVGVPDIENDSMPLSLLRIPGYPLVILFMRVVAGDFWITALIGVQLFASLCAVFVLYRAMWLFSHLWLLGVLAAGWFAFSSIGVFERCILSDSLGISILTVVACHVSSAAFRGRELRPIGVASIAMAFPMLFLLREMNMLLALSLVPLLLMASPRVRGLRRVVWAYGPVIFVFVTTGLWQQYRTGYFLITTGGQGNPIEALALIDKISPVFDQDGTADRVVRSVTAEMEPADILRDPWSVAVKINERLAKQLSLQAPELSRLALRRYLSVWLDHPYEMLAHMVRNQALIRTAGVSPFLYNDPQLPGRAREFYSYASQQVIEWGLVNFPLLWFAALVAAAPLRRTALLGLALWFAAMVPVSFYSGMFLETRYVLPTLGPVLLVIALTIGTGIRVLSRRSPQPVGYRGNCISEEPRSKLCAGPPASAVRPDRSV